MSNTPRTNEKYRQILDDALGLEYCETELRYWSEQLERELAEAVEKERERCAKVCIEMADDFEIEVNQRGLVERMKQHFGVK